MYKSELRFANDLSNYVLNMISGNHDNCKRIQLFTLPSKYFILGSLADISFSEDEVEEEESDAFTTAKTAVKLNSMSISFLVEKKYNSSILVRPSCSLFVKTFPNYKEQKEYLNQIDEDPSLIEKQENPDFATIWLRKDCDFDPITTKLQPKKTILDFSPFINDIYTNYTLYGTAGFSRDWMVSEEDYNNKISSAKSGKRIFSWKAEISVERFSFDNNFEQIIIRFTNKTKNSKAYETFLFNCSLEIDLKETNIHSYIYKYDYEGFPNTKNEYFRTLNCHYEKINNIVKLVHWGTFIQQKYIPRISFDGLSAEFRVLASENSIKTLEKLYEKMMELNLLYKANTLYIDTRSKYHHDAIHFEHICERFKNGIDVLKKNRKALQAFKFMQETFSNAVNYTSWRLFQIVFIVSILPDLTDQNIGRDFTDLVHVNTGGGKSETYFGILAFLMFYDRLRGKTEGVTGIVKFPLRMLSIQQLQRLAKIIVWADEIRKNNEISPKNFSMGYYVGLASVPRYSHGEIRKIIQGRDNGKVIPGKFLSDCPICKMTNSVVLDFESDRRVIVHKCTKCERVYYLYYTNEDVYKAIPSVIVSTVDKFASVATNRRVKNLLGGKLGKCPHNHGYSPFNDKCETYSSSNKQCGEFAEGDMYRFEGPTVMIQDELHLLKEGFGTIDSHFEGLLNALLNEFSGKDFKYLAMSATVSGVDDQIMHLYGKDTKIFPGTSPELNSSKDFFFNLEKDENGEDMAERILFGLKPNLRDNQYSSLLTIYHIAVYINNVYQDINEFSSVYGLSKEDFLKLLSNYDCLLTYHTKKADVHGMNYYLHTVVTSKLKSKIDVIPQPLTGDNTLEEIKKVIKRIEEFKEKNLHVTFATSVVSHGVDIEKWNIMIFQGMTRNTAEYIQSLSRVGRRRVGIVFLWFYPTRVRDLSYYQNFKMYHEILYHKVERSPVSRFAYLGCMQTFQSMFCGSILNYIADLREEPVYKVNTVNDIFSLTSNRIKLIDFIKKAYKIDLPIKGTSQIELLINTETENRLNYLVKYKGSNINFFPGALSDCDNYYYATQYGMRGIQPQVVLSLKPAYQKLYSKFMRRRNNEDE